MGVAPVTTYWGSAYVVVVIMLYGKLLFAIISKRHFYRNISWCSGFGAKPTTPFESTPWAQSKYRLGRRFSLLYKVIRARNCGYFSEKTESDIWSTDHSFGSWENPKYMTIMISILCVQRLSPAAPLHIEFFLFDRQIFLGFSTCQGLRDENIISRVMHIFILYTACTFDPCNQNWKILTTYLYARNHLFFPKISLLQVESIFCCSGAFSRFRHYHLPKLLFVIYRCCSLCFRRNRVIFNRIHHRTRMHFASRFSVFHMTAIHFPYVIYHLYIVMCVLRHLYFDFFANRNYSSSHDCDMIELWNFVFNIFMVPLLYPPY